MRRGVLFDLDGTLIDSTPSIQRCWGRVLDELGISRDVLDSLHGAPSSQSLKRLLPDADAETLQYWAAKIEEFEVADTDGIIALPGVHDTLEYLRSHDIPWLVVTSCTRDLGLARSRAVGLELPANTVFFTDVTRGKPDPEPFLLGAQRLGISSDLCIAVEDAPTGITSSKSAGAYTIAIATTYGAEHLSDADEVVADHAELVTVLQRLLNE